MDTTTQHISSESSAATTNGDTAEFSHKLAYRLRELRALSGYTQEHVAEQAGIAAYTYQKFEKGESKPGTPMNPRLYTLLALADVFEISVTELLDLDYEEGASALEPDPDTDIWLGRTPFKITRRIGDKK